MPTDNQDILFVSAMAFGIFARPPATQTCATFVWACSLLGLQGLFNYIFATFAQLDLGMDKRTALDILVVVNITAALSRILWGWIGSSLAPSRIVLSALAFLMGIATIALGASTTTLGCSV